MDKIICRSCVHEPFVDYKELAIHILLNKIGHRKGLLWARKFMSKQKMLDRKLSMKNRNRASVSDDDKQAKEDSRRELSGDKKLVITICPKCKAGERRHIESEHANNPEAWRIKNCLVLLCGVCK